MTATLSRVGRATTSWRAAAAWTRSKGDLQTDLATIPGGAEPDDRPDAVTANGTDDSESVFVSGSAGNGTVVGGPGYDIFCGGDGSDVLFGGPGNDVLVGGGGGNDIIGQD